MSDYHELLKLAAKAAGIEFDFCRSDLGGCQIRKGLTSGWWNPLEDDGDALRLAVKLNMHVIVDGENKHVRVYARSWAKADEDYGTCGFGDDPYAATCRAIVRAAAEIGKELP